MCQFLSVISDGKGEIYYADWEMRETDLKKDWDSHSFLADYYKLKIDGVNKYEYNPLLKKITIDQINNTDDSRIVDAKINCLDFKKIIPQLIIKPIINPLEITRSATVTEEEIELLKKWASMRDSVWASVRAYIGSFFTLAKNQWKHCEKIDFKDGENPFQCCIDLWGAGLVPSCGSTTWRLHAGEKAEIVYEWKKEEI